MRYMALDTIPTLHIKRIARLVVMDMLIVLVAYLATYTIRLMTPPLVDKEGLELILVTVFSTPALLYVFGVYHRIWERTSGHEITVIVKAVSVLTAWIIALDLIYVPRTLPMSVIIVSHVLALGGFVTVRYRSRLFGGLSYRWQLLWRHEAIVPRTRVLIVGAGEAGQTLAWRLKHRFPTHDYTVVGFIDDDPGKKNFFVEGCKVLGNRTDIPWLVETYQVDMIVIAIHRISGPTFREIVEYCEQSKARIKVIPDILALIGAKYSDLLLRDVQLEDLIGRTTVVRHEAVDLTPVTNRAILVTGAAGSIGSELCRQLILCQPSPLLLLDVNESALYDLVMDLSARHPDAHLVPILADIADYDALRMVFTEHQPQVVFHAAAFKHVPMLEQYPHEAVRVNIGGTRNLAELSLEFHVERFVLISTDKAVRPTSVMGASKRVCECLLNTLSHQRGQKTLFTSVRFGNVLGSRGSVVPLFTRQIENGGPVTITHPEMTRYFMSIPEAVNLVIHAACMTEGGDTFVLKMGEVVHILELAKRMIRLRGMRPNVDVEIKFTGVRPGEKMHEELYESSEAVTETIHPHIVKVVSPDDVINPTLFLHRLDLLSASLSDNPKEVLTQMLNLIYLDSSVPYKVSA